MTTITLLLALLLLGPQRVGVLEFENTGKDRALDWIGTGIAETLSAELGRIPGLTLVERNRLNDVLKEIKLGRSQFVDPGTAQRMGKLLGADTVVVGSFQRFQDQLRIVARFVDVETGVVRTPVMVEGPYEDIFKLQTELAAKLAGAELEAVARANNVAALQAFSDGVYFYRNNLVADALAQFDRALSLEPNYADAHFYKGLALEKLERWDDAIAAFKRALPRTQPERRVTWSWDAPFTADRSKRGIVAGIDTSELSPQRSVLNRDGLAALQKRVIYGERSGKNTILYFVDLEQHSVKRLELPDDKINLNDIAVATDRLTILTSADISGLRAPDSIRLYGVGASDGAIWWHEDLKNFGLQLPMIGVASDLGYLFFPANGTLAAFDVRTARTEWTRENIGFDRLESPKLRATRANGNVLVVKSDKTLRAIRVRDGKDAWVIEPQNVKFTHIVTGDAVVIFDPNHSVTIFDLESGKTRLEVPVAQFTNNLRLGPFGSTVLVGAAVEENTLYFLSNALELYAVALDSGVLWHTPLKRKMTSLRVDGERVYAGTETGELLILDVASGAIKASLKIAPKDLTLDFANNEIVIASAEKAVYGLDPLTGAKRWEYPANFSPKGVTYLKGVVTVRTSLTQLSALDAETGTLLWQYAGSRAPGIFTTKESFFIIEENGVKEYAIDNRVRVTNREVFTELASALVSKGDLQQATTVLDRVANEIDANYQPMRAIRARLERARGNPRGAARELAAIGAIDELKRDHGLLWHERLDAGAAGDPSLVGDKLISVGRSVGGRNQLVALNSASGRTIWRQSLERFSDVVIDPSTERAWYISGDGEDPGTVVLYSLSVQTGERKELARWTRPPAVSLASLAYARERLFVITVSPDVPNSRVTVAIDSFTAEGHKLWNRTHESTADLLQMQVPIGLFAPAGEYLMYSAGQDLWTLSAATGAVVREHRENGVIAPRLLRNDAGAVFFVTGRQEIVGYNPESGSVTLRAALPENTLTFVIRANALYATNGSSVFALDLASSRLTWRLEADKDQRFLRVLESGEGLWALREDATLVQIDRSTGKILAEQSTLWQPSGLSLTGDRLYAFTSDRAAYALQLGF